MGSSELAHRECHTRTGLQVALKRHRPSLVSELHDDIDNPWPARDRVRTMACVVRVQPCGEIGSQASVVPGWIGFTLENVDECAWVEPSRAARARRPPDNTEGNLSESTSRVPLTPSRGLPTVAHARFGVREGWWT